MSIGQSRIGLLIRENKLFAFDSLFLFLLSLSVFGLCINNRDLEALTLEHAGVEAIAKYGSFSLGQSRVPRLHSPDDSVQTKGMLLSEKPVGQFIVAAPGYFLAGLFGFSYETNFLRTAAIVSLCSSGIGLAAVASLLYFLCAAVWRFHRSTSALIGIAIAFAQTATASVGVPQREVIATFFLVAAFFLSELQRESSSSSRLLSATSGFLAGWALFCSLLSLPFLLVFLAFSSWRTSRCGALVLGFAVGLLPIVFYNLCFYDSPLGTSDSPWSFRLDSVSLAPSDVLQRMKLLLGQYGISLLSYTPICLLGFLGLLTHREDGRFPRFLLVSAVILHLLTVVCFNLVGSCEYGPESLIPVLPFLILGLASFDRVPSPWRTDVFVVLWSVCLLSIVFNLSGAIGSSNFCSVQEWGPRKYLTHLELFRGRSFPLFSISLPFFFLVLTCFLRYLGTPNLEPGDRSSSDYWRSDARLAVWLSVLCALVYYFSKLDNSAFDYTMRVASAFLHGQLGLESTPPSWLNEFVPFEGKFYSVFPLGAVLSMLPLAALRELGLIQEFPTRALVAFIGATQTLVIYSLLYRLKLSRVATVVLVAFFDFGTWHWVDLSMAGAWQIAIGLAVLGQLGALLYSLATPRPFLCGLFFALAFGNRTEIILLAPIYLFLLSRHSTTGSLRELSRLAFWFSLAPFVLGSATLLYNYERFGSLFDFGYARIPGVLEEPWYRDGIFSFSAVLLNVRQMLFVPWRSISDFPYVNPTGFGGSILLASPLLLIMGRRPLRLQGYGAAFGFAVLILCLVLWCHGNPGGWQYSYRYAAILLPWFLCLLARVMPGRIYWVDGVLLSLSILCSIWATLIFNIFSLVQPWTARPSEASESILERVA